MGTVKRGRILGREVGIIALIFLSSCGYRNLFGEAELYFVKRIDPREQKIYDERGIIFLSNESFEIGDSKYPVKPQSCSSNVCRWRGPQLMIDYERGKLLTIYLMNEVRYVERNGGRYEPFEIYTIIKER